MNLTEFFEEASQHGTRLGASRPDLMDHRTTLLSNEALFQLPFLAMVILAISKGNKKPKLSEVGQLVGECLERTLLGFKGTSQYIGWSANLRIRTIKALTFLETSMLAEVDVRAKTISVTATGKTILEFAMGNDGNLAETLRQIERSYRNISAESKIKLELS